jgi:hypothetical protein
VRDWHDLVCILNLHSVCKWVLRGRVRNREFRPGLWGHRRNSVPSPMARRGGDLWLCSMRRDDLLFLHGVPTMAHGHACLHPPWSWLPATRQDGLRAWTIREGSGHRMSLTHTEYDFYATKCLTWFSKKTGSTTCQWTRLTRSPGRQAPSSGPLARLSMVRKLRLVLPSTTPRCARR